MLAFGTGIAQLLVSVLYILTARAMRPDEYGLIISSISLGIAIAGFTDFGANQYWVRELASQRLSHEALNARASTRFAIVLTLALATAIFTLTFAPAFLATAVLLLSTSTVQTVLVPLRAIQRSESIGWLVILGRAISLTIFFALTHLQLSPAVALWASLALGDLLLIAFAYAVTPAEYRLQFEVSLAMNPWSGTKWYALSVVSTSAQQLDLPIVATVAGPGAAGIYGGVNRWTQPMLVAIGAFGSAAAPFIAATPQLRAVRTQLLRASWILIAAIGLSLTVFIAAPWLVTSILGEDFATSVPVLRVISIAMLLNAVTQPLLMTLQARKFDRLVAAILALTVTTQLIIVAVLAPKFGALGAGLGVLVAQVVALLSTLICIAAIIRRREPRN